MIEAMWGVEFISNTGNGGFGVAVLETGRILGGDSSYVYIGSYKIANGLLKANIQVTNDREMLDSIFGDMRQFNLRGQAEIRDEYLLQEFTMFGEMTEDPTKQILVKFTRRVELP